MDEANMTADSAAEFRGKSLFLGSEPLQAAANHYSLAQSDGTDGDASDGTDGDSTGDSTDTDGTDADGTDGTDADGTDGE